MKLVEIGGEIGDTLRNTFNNVGLLLNFTATRLPFVTEVSRDSLGITLERAVKVLDTLNVRLRTKVEIDNPSEMVST